MKGTGYKHMFIEIRVDTDTDTENGYSFTTLFIH